MQAPLSLRPMSKPPRLRAAIRTRRRILRRTLVDSHSVHDEGRLGKTQVAFFVSGPRISHDQPTYKAHPRKLSRLTLQPTHGSDPMDGRLAVNRLSKGAGGSIPSTPTKVSER